MTPQHVTITPFAHIPGPLLIVAFVGLVCVVVAIAFGHVSAPAHTQAAAAVTPDCPVCGQPRTHNHKCSSYTGTDHR